MPVATLSKLKTKSIKGKLQELAVTQEGYVSSFDGTKLWYKSVGKGVPLVCCNGLGCSTFYFSYLVDHFKQSHQVVIWDYRGHGRSEFPRVRKNHTVYALTRDLKVVMDALKIKKAILVGHSMGTQVIYEFYTNHSERVLALIPCFGTFANPVETFLDFPFSKYIFEVIYIFNHLFPKLSHLIGTLLVKNPLWFQVGGLMKMMKPYLVDRKIMEQYLDHIINVDPIFLSKLTKSMQEHSAESTLKNIRVPTLILGAEEDTFTPLWLSKKMYHLIPGSELFVVKNATHVALVEQPELIHLRIERFLSERVLKNPKQISSNLKIIK